MARIFITSSTLCLLQAGVQASAVQNKEHVIQFSNLRWRGAKILVSKFCFGVMGCPFFYIFQVLTFAPP